MSTNLRCKAVMLGLTLTAAPVFAPAAMATPITYNFTVNVNNGPLAGTVENGTFTYDSSSVIPGSFNNATGLLTALAFTFNGIAYNAGTANTGILRFDGAGNLVGFAFGNNCVAGNCSVYRGTNQWFAQPGTGGFLYSTPAFDDYADGNVSFALASVPEPGALGLFGFGLLLLLGAAARRRLMLRSAD